MKQALKCLVTLALDFVLRFQKLHLKAEFSKAEDKRTALEALGRSRDDVDISYRGALIVFLRTILKRFPYWALGHLELARIAFAQRDFALAYASTLAVEKLSTRTPLLDEALFLRAKCMIATHEYRGAEKILRSLAERSTVPRFDVLEELGAALFGLGQEDDAKRCLQEIPEDAQSQACRSALEYLNRNTRAEKS